MMKKAMALFLSLLIFTLSFFAQGETIFSYTQADSISVEGTATVAQQMAGCPSESIDHPCHFGHLGGCAPIGNSQISLSSLASESNVFVTKSLRYSAPFLDRLDRPPIS